MAPGRKKGCKVAVAEASKLDWNRGDLVLAKVKGHPWWPAKVSHLVYMSNCFAKFGNLISSVNLMSLTG